jgi:uncharacterized protein
VLHVVPRAARTGVAGRHGDAVKIRIAAPPTDGSANDELIRFLAERLNIPRAAIAITTGASSRRKTVEISGLETTTVLRLLEDG